MIGVLRVKTTSENTRTSMAEKVTEIISLTVPALNVVKKAICLVNAHKVEVLTISTSSPMRIMIAPLSRVDRRMSLKRILLTRQWTINCVQIINLCCLQ